MTDIKWLFFDLGATLVDETDVYKARCDFAIKAKNINPDEFINKVREAAEKSATAIKDAADYYGVTLPPWDNTLEKLYPETETVIEKLSHKYKLGIIANQTAGTKSRLDKWGIGKYFDVVVASAEAGCAKPDLQIFELALEQSGCMSKNAAMIGDRLDNDIVPAKKLGMKTIWARQEFAKHQKINDKSAQPDYTVDNLNELLEIL